MLSIFANINISTRERLANLQASYKSMEGISDNWLINIRGKYRQQAIAYLRRRLGSKAIFFNLLDDSRGWMVNSLDMLSQAKYSYLLVWNEDHLNTAPVSLYTKIVSEMSRHNVQYMIYSWWFFGEIRAAFDSQRIRKGKYIDSVMLTRRVWEKVKSRGYKHYIISMVAIFRKDLLRKFFVMDARKWPFFISKLMLFVLSLGKKLKLSYNMHTAFGKVNMVLGNYLARYPKETPFELEKDPERVDILPIKVGLPKRELFACLNDDGGFEGYKLTSRMGKKR